MDIGSINFSGLASGLDTKSLISAILSAESKPITNLQTRQSTLTQKKAALDDLRSKLSTFQTALQGLSSGSSFLARDVTISDDSYLGATVGSGAQAGLYSVEVLALAAAHKVRTNGYAAANQGLVADGTLTIRAGNEDPISVEVSAAAGNNSLNAIRDAINAQDKGVLASVLYDGTSYRLVLTSEDTGVSHAMTIDEGTTGLGLTAPANVVTSARDSRVQVDGLEVTSASNQISGVIEGVTLNLRKMTTGDPVTVEVSENHKKVVESVQSLMTAYNGVMDFFNEQFDRDNPGVLSGDATARDIQSRVMSLVTGGVEGIADGQVRSLSAIGVSFDGESGKMTLDTTELEDLLETRFDEVGRLFVASGTATDTAIRYYSSTSSTAAGSYTVQITRAAEQASVTGAQELGSTLGRDETLTIGVGSASTTVALTSGMTQAQVVDAVNAALRTAELGAAASLDGGRLRIASRQFGSAISLSVSSSVGDAGAGSGFGSTAATDTGVDVAGTFNGVAGSATGRGQILTGNSGGGWAGLSLQVAATTADVASSTDFGSFSFSPGLVKTLSTQLSSMTNSTQGPIALARDAMTETIKSMSEDISRMEDRLEKRRAYLIRQFSAAEKAISALQSQQAQFQSSLS